LEVGAEFDYALRSANDNQLFAVDNVDFQFLLDYFNVEVPPNFDYTIDIGGSSGGSSSGSDGSDATPAPAPTESVPEG